MRAALLPLALLVAVPACTEAVDSHVSHASDAPFERYRTFAFDPVLARASRHDAPGVAAASASRAEALAAELMRSKGYAPAPADGDADLVVRLFAGRREHARRDPEQNRASPVDADEEQDFLEGRLVVDVVDAATGRVVWHGAARTEVEPGQVDDDLLRRSLARVLGGFPRRVAR